MHHPLDIAPHACLELACPLRSTRKVWLFNLGAEILVAVEGIAAFTLTDRLSIAMLVEGGCDLLLAERLLPLLHDFLMPGVPALNARPIEGIETNKTN